MKHSLIFYILCTIGCIIAASAAKIYDHPELTYDLAFGVGSIFCFLTFEEIYQMAKARKQYKADLLSAV